MHEHTYEKGNGIFARIEEARNRCSHPWLSVPRTENTIATVGRTHIGFLPLELRHLHNLFTEVLSEYKITRAVYEKERMNYQVAEADYLGAHLIHSHATDKDRAYFKKMMHVDWQEMNEWKYYTERAKHGVQVVRDTLVHEMHIFLPLNTYADFIILCNWMVVGSSRADRSKRIQSRLLSHEEQILGKLEMPKGEVV